MNIPRIFFTAVVRRIAYVVVALVLAALASLVPFGEAQAATTTCPGAVPRVCDQGEAYADISRQLGEASSQNCQHGVHAVHVNNPTYGGGAGNGSYGGTYQCRLQNGSPGSPNSTGIQTAFFGACREGSWNEETKSCYTCDFNGPPLGAGHVQCTGSEWASCPRTVCSGGCGYDQPAPPLEGYVIDGTRWAITTGWMPRGETCTVGDTPGLGTPPSDADGDGTSDPNDSSPNNPGSGGSGDDGESPSEDGSSTCGGPGQPECAEDGSNAGSGKGNTSGGGGNCQTPPSSTGDAILAQIAYQAWATRCAVEAQGQGGSGTGPGEGDGDQPGWTEGNGPADPEDTSAQDIDEASDWGIGLSADLLNTENIFGNASCPALPSFSIMGYEIDTSAFSWWCTLISIMRAAILIMGGFTAIQILLRGF